MPKNNQYIYVLRPARIGMMVDGGTKEEQALVGQHFSYLKRLTEEGTAILMGRTQETVEETIGIVIFNAACETDTERIMKDDPAVKNGVMSAELFQFRIALFNPAAADS